jgi:poly(A) polymerase
LRYRYENISGHLVKKATVWTAKEHHIDADKIDEYAVFIIRRLQRAGYETYIVGGAVRDLLLAKEPKDIDIATNATPAQIRRVIHNSRLIGKRFQLIHVFRDGKIFEVATFRSMKDGNTSNSFGTIDDDVLRRDFSMNALFYDPVDDVVVDYVGGFKDIEDKVLRPIIPLQNIFKDDPVRIIRAVKYASACGFKIPLNVKSQIKKDKHLLKTVSVSRLSEELSKIINNSESDIIIGELFNFGIWEYLQPHAFLRMKTNPEFMASYIAGFRALRDSKVFVSGEAHAALIRGYINQEVNFADSGIDEAARDVYYKARAFISPAALTRHELAQGVKIIFKEHGVNIKKSKVNDLQRGRQRKPRAPNAIRAKTEH